MPEISSEQATVLGQSFAAIDFETATSERRSACAVGVVVFEQGLPTDTLNLLIRPPDNHYDSFNTMIHGIGPSDTRHAPDFPESWERVAQLLDGRLVVAHNTAFDLSVLRRSAEHHCAMVNYFMQCHTLLLGCGHVRFDDPADPGSDDFRAVPCRVGRVGCWCWAGDGGDGGVADTLRDRDRGA